MCCMYSRNVREISALLGNRLIDIQHTGTITSSAIKKISDGIPTVLKTNAYNNIQLSHRL